jgi:hypothetical protein
MPTTLAQIQYASISGILDEDALTQGHFPDAHVLSALSNTGNRLAGKGNYLAHEVFRVSGAVDEVAGSAGLWAVNEWSKVRVYPLVQRKPHLRTAEVRIRANITSGATVVFQVSTGAVLPRPSPTAASQVNCATCLGTGAWAWYTWTIQLAALEDETLELWVYGDPASVTISAPYGTPSSGSCAAAVGYTQMSITGATWTTLMNRAYVVCEWRGVDGNPVAARRRVQRAIGAQDTLWWVVPMGEDELPAARAPGSTYNLFIGAQMRIGAIVIREIDAYAP